jgi:hypothetical protein
MPENLKDSMEQSINNAIDKTLADIASINAKLQSENEKSSISELAKEIFILLKKVATDSNEPNLEKVNYIETKVKVLSNSIITMKSKNPLISDLLVADINDLDFDIKQLITLIENKQNRNE